MKNTASPEDAQRNIVRVRFAQALHQQSALDSHDDERVHAFRLACKRLRFALERLDPQAPGIERALLLLSRLTDELGWAHDCMQLAQIALECAAPLVAVRAGRDRDRYVLRARRLWRHAFRSSGEFAELAGYAGFTWSVS